MNTLNLLKYSSIALTALLFANYAQAFDSNAPLKEASTSAGSASASIPDEKRSEHNSASSVAVKEQPEALPANPKTNANIVLFRQLDELRSQNALLAEALKNADLKSKLGDVAKSKGSDTARNPSTGPDLNQGLPSAYGVSESLGAMSAQVLLVSGVDTKLSALISLPGSGRVTAKVGSYIPGVGVVKSISLNEVLVENKKQLVTLPFASDASENGMSGVTSIGAR